MLQLLIETHFFQKIQQSDTCLTAVLIVRRIFTDHGNRQIALVGKDKGITHTLTNLSGTHPSRIKATDSAGETRLGKAGVKPVHTDRVFSGYLNHGDILR